MPDAKNWETIWTERDVESSNETEILGSMLRASGYDYGPGYVTEEEYLESVRVAENLMALQQSDKVLDLGCGAGALSYVLGREGGPAVTGVDISKNLLNFARAVNPSNLFIELNLNGIGRNGHRLPGSYDWIVALSLFQYLPRDDALNLFREALSIARKGVLISDLPDSHRREESEEYRRQLVGLAEYSKRYSHLPHSYYSSSDFRMIVAEPLFSSSWDLQVQDKSIIDYPQGRLRFTVVA